jgi:DNA-directed RNA polymerase specialized sigma24 family protein
MSTIGLTSPGGWDAASWSFFERYLNKIIRNKGCDHGLARAVRRRIFALVRDGVRACGRDDRWRDLIPHLASVIQDRSRRKGDPPLKALALFIDSIVEEVVEEVAGSIYGNVAGPRATRTGGPESLESIASRAGDPAEAAMEAEEAEAKTRLAEAIDRLSGRQREAIKLLRAGHTVREIGDCLNLGRSATYALLGSAREALARSLRRPE